MASTLPHLSGLLLDKSLSCTLHAMTINYTCKMNSYQSDLLMLCYLILIKHFILGWCILTIQTPNTAFI